MDMTGQCRICGMEVEDTYHALIRCTPARMLWDAMREVWPLPQQQQIQNLDHEWLMLLLVDKSQVEQMMILMLLWRVWHVHNELTQDKPAPTIEGSRRFLCSYLESLLIIRQQPTVDIMKGKFSVRYDISPTRKTVSTVTPACWQRPPPGWIKLNTDGSFVTPHDRAGAGMILRDHKGHILISVCRSLLPSSDALEAEL